LVQFLLLFSFPRLSARQPAAQDLLDPQALGVVILQRTFAPLVIVGGIDAGGVLDIFDLAAVALQELPHHTFAVGDWC
jgi:hypothetical protein